MILEDDFFQIIEQNGNDFLIKLNKNHFIYCSHFPKNPITPGVIILQIAVELLQTTANCKLFLKKIKNIKYLAVINPEIDDYVQFRFLKIEIKEKVYSVLVEICNGQKQFSKISAQLINVEKD